MRYYAWLGDGGEAIARWAHLLDTGSVPAGARDCTDMTDGEFEDFVRSLLHPPQRQLGEDSKMRDSD